MNLGVKERLEEKSDNTELGLENTSFSNHLLSFKETSKKWTIDIIYYFMPNMDFLNPLSFYSSLSSK